MHDFLIRPGNPLDYTKSELDDLLASMSDVEGATIRMQYDFEQSYGVTFYEVIQVISNVRGAGGDLVLGAVIAKILAWQRKRYKRDRAEYPDSNPRPRSIVVRDADGNTLDTIDLPEEPDEKRPRAE